MEVATFNLENLFTRPRAMNLETDDKGRQAIEDHAWSRMLGSSCALLVLIITWLAV